MSKDIFKGSSIVGSLTLISRILGFIWNLVIAKVFGASYVADIFFVAYRIPNILRSFLAEGAFTSAFVPAFSQEIKANLEQAKESLKSITGFLVILTTIVSILGIIFAREIVSLIAPGFINDPKKFELCITLTKITLPYIIFVSVISLVNGALNNMKIFGASPIAQITMNIVMIIFSWIASFFDQELGIKILAISVIFGGIIQILVQIPSLRKVGFSIIPKRPFITPFSKKVIKLMLPAIFGSAVYQLSIFVNTILASFLETGSVSWLFYADRIALFPIGIITIAIVSVLLPELSRSHNNQDNDKFKLDFLNTLSFTSFLLIPASLGLIILAEPITTILFERGEFTRTDTINTYQAVQAMAFGLWGVSCNAIITRAFLAKQNTRLPALLSFCTLVINLILALLLMGTPIESNSTLYYIVINLQSLLTQFLPSLDLRHIGLAFASGMSVTLIFTFSIILLNIKYLNFSLNQFLISTFKAITSSIVMVFAILATKTLITNTALYLIIAIIISAPVYLFTGLVLRSNEAKICYQKVRRKI